MQIGRSSGIYSLAFMHFLVLVPFIMINSNCWQKPVNPESKALCPLRTCKVNVTCGSNSPENRAKC